jgi:DNA (cytosine-5)-methyltransferase 1
LNRFRFIDLFAGIGGFHQAMASLGGECVLASEIDRNAIEVYRENYGIGSGIDIRKIDENAVPDFDVLCAGFPCQSFSRAGSKLGLKDRTRGTLFFDIVRILQAKRPKWFILENVRHIVGHDSGRTWKIIQDSIRELGYRTTAEPLLLSPHQFGIPQARERVVILGMLDEESVSVPLPVSFSGLLGKEDCSIYSVLDEREDGMPMSERERQAVDIWDEFHQNVEPKIIGLPIWIDALNADPIPFGTPKRTVYILKKNREIYLSNRDFIGSWLERHGRMQDFQPSHRRYEWQAGTAISSAWEGIIQFRPSGLRIKAPNCFPTLVAMNATQVPIVGRYRRRLSVREAARLQCFPVDGDPPFVPDRSPRQAYRQFGNAVNVEVIRQAAMKLFECRPGAVEEKSGVFAFC